MAPPVGLTIGAGPRKPQWKIGKEIGSGACGSVHLLKHPAGKESSFVVKVVPLPTKITKKKNSLAERNARLLSYEEQVYRNQFPDYQGFIIPKFPPYIGPPIFGDIEGFRFLVLEKMKGPLWDVIPALLKSDSPTIDLAPIAQQLLVCVKAFHSEGQLLIDVKPDNFMLAFSNQNRKKKAATSKKNTSKSTEAAEDLAQKVRVLDLGLVAPWKGPQGHRADDGISEVVGTPLYASLHVISKHTPSRRDDMEALCYVIGELIIRLVAEARGDLADYESTDDNGIPSYLPWSQEKSDKKIGEVKSREIKNIKGKFFSRMGDKEVAKAMKSLFDLTQNMKYKEKPDYEEFEAVFSSLQVTVEPQKKKARASPGRARKASRATRSKRTASRTDGSSDEQSPSPKKQQKRTTVDHEDEFVDAAMDVDSDDDYEDANEDMQKEEEVFEDAEEDAMEWEQCEPDAKENHIKPGNTLGIVVEIEAGPHAGEHFELKRGEIETLILGQNPRVDKPVRGQALWPLTRERSAADVHARLDLKASRQLCSVNLTDLETEEGTLVESKTVSGSMRVFINEKFKIGNSIFLIREPPKFGGGSASNPIATKATTSTKANNSIAKAKKALGQKSETSTKPAQARKAKSGPGILLQIVSGPHTGESFTLSASDGVNTITVGSEKKRGKGGKGELVVLGADEAIEPQHARFVLVSSKKLVKVAVVDLSDAGTLVNGKKTRKNKEHMAFVGDRCTMGDTVLEIKPL